MGYIETINYFEKLISGSTDHAYLKQYIDEPVYDRHQILALHELTKNDSQYEQLIHTTMLVQIALNTHDKIKGEFPSDKSLKQQQLTVLAGDYFSGIYYYILAQHNNLPFIRLLAAGINEITQLKMRVFYHQYENIEAFRDDYRHIHIGLAAKVAQYTKQEEAIGYLSNWLMLKHIEQEISFLYNGQESLFQHLLADNVSIEKSFDSFKNVFWQLHSFYKMELDHTNHLFTALTPDLDIYHITDHIKDRTCSLEEGLPK